MSFCLKFYIPIVIVIIISLYYERSSKILEEKISTYSGSSVLIIGILSARENILQRKAIRSTWLKSNMHSKNVSVKAWFILGNNSCAIPSEYRISKYSCEKWNLNISGLNNQFCSSYEIPSKECPPNLPQVFHQGFSFKVNHPVIIKRLGILNSLLAPGKETKVAVLDVQSKAIVVQASIMANSSHTKNGYLYQEVETVLLPKDYEGMVLVEGYLLHAACSTIMWNDNGGVITYKRVYTTPSHMDSIKFSPDIFVAASIQFLVHDISSLKEVILQEETATTQWTESVQKINKKIMTEKEENNDIIILNEIDTYRKLPVKLLHFYKWVHENYDFSYVLKTDDDCVIDLSRLIQVLETLVYDSSKPFIWSRFRKEWRVNYIGKWADFDYQSSLYPAFPCGAAYVISQKTVAWLSSNIESLHPYQGEDVSMGIWLSAIHPNYMQDENFECGSQCHTRSYNRAQLTPDQIYNVWSLYEKCQNLCSCD